MIAVEPGASAGGLDPPVTPPVVPPEVLPLDPLPDDPEPLELLLPVVHPYFGPSLLDVRSPDVR